MKMKSSSIFLAACLMILVGFAFQPQANAADYFIRSMPVYAIVPKPPPDDSGPMPNFSVCPSSPCSSWTDWCMTPSEFEKNSALANGWEAQGIAFYTSIAQIPGTVRLYRLYNPTSTDHLFTTSLDEKNRAMKMGYYEEGTAGYVFPKNKDVVGTRPLHRWYAGGDFTYHRYSLSMKEKYYPEVYEGQECHVWPSAMAMVSMSVTRPKVHEILQGNSEYKITWDSSRKGGFVNVFFSPSITSKWTPIVYGITNDGFLTWKVPNIDTTQARIQIVWVDNLIGNSYHLARVDSKLFIIKKVPLKIKAAEVKPVATPSAPSPLAATAISATETKLLWKASTGQPIGYVVERRMGQGMFMQVANIKALDIAYSDKDVTPGTKYSYRVYAYNMGGNSDYSNEASAQTAFTLRKLTAVQKKTTK